MKKTLIIIIFAGLILTLIINRSGRQFFNHQPINNQLPSNPVPTTTLIITAPITSTPKSITSNKLFPPISQALSRVTKKPLGIYVSPHHSPVSPEKFTGYHTGVDFETYPNEANQAIPIYAACDGYLLLKKWATGYGGVAVQSCQLNKQAITIIYGHLKLASIIIKIGDQIKAGDQIGVLGQGYSIETDGERKHLHFGIHQGSAINILGYVQKPADLNGWLDPLKFLP